MYPDTSSTFTATPDGISVNGLPLTKAASANFSPEALRYVKRAKEMLAKVKPGDWYNRAPHRTNDIPLLARAQMLLALASPQPFLPLLKALAKDESNNSDEDDDDDADDGDDYDSGGGNGHYNPDEPRIPAGQPGGGQWTTGAGGSEETHLEYYEPLAYIPLWFEELASQVFASLASQRKLCAFGAEFDIPLATFQLREVYCHTKSK